MQSAFSYVDGFGEVSNTPCMFCQTLKALNYIDH